MSSYSSSNSHSTPVVSVANVTDDLEKSAPVSTGISVSINPSSDPYDLRKGVVPHDTFLRHRKTRKFNLVSDKGAKVEQYQLRQNVVRTGLPGCYPSRYLVMLLFSVDR